MKKNSIKLRHKKFLNKRTEKVLLDKMYDLLGLNPAFVDNRETIINDKPNN